MIDVVVTRKRREAEGIYSFELAPVEDFTLPDFSAGAHIDVHLPNGLVRQYSLCDQPEERHSTVGSQGWAEAQLHREHFTSAAAPAGAQSLRFPLIHLYLLRCFAN